MELYNSKKVEWQLFLSYGVTKHLTLGSFIEAKKMLKESSLFHHLMLEDDWTRLLIRNSSIEMCLKKNTVI